MLERVRLQAGTGARGRLRIYLGMAPGVGKTYAMLHEGRRRKKRGTHVVVGFVETYNRPLTVDAIGDLEVIPRKKIELFSAVATGAWIGPGAIRRRAAISRWAESPRALTCNGRSSTIRATEPYQRTGAAAVITKCQGCSQENREGRRFCAQCGASLAATCASCGAPYESGEKFCGGCGKPLSSGAEPVPTSSVTASPSPALPASFADGRYVVRSFLGEGGRKKVYLAHDAKLDRDVAVAVIKTEGLDDAGLSRVKREAQAMGRLGDHPNIVTVFDIGEPHLFWLAGAELHTNEGVRRARTHSA